jgi:hypothetical protein
MNLAGVVGYLANAGSAFTRADQHRFWQRGSILVLLARGAARFDRSLFVAASFVLAACNLDNPGTTQPEGVLTYPIALAFSSSTVSTRLGPGEAPRYLYVANTNVDVRYNGASVQSYDLQALEDKLLSTERDGRDCLERPPEPDAGDAGEAELDGGLDADAPDADVDADAATDLDTGLDGGGMDASDAITGEAGDDAEASQIEAGEPEAGSDADADLADAGTDTGVVIGPVDPGLREVEERSALRGRLCDRRDTPLDQGDPNSGEPDDETVCCYGAKDVLDELRAGEVSIDSFASAMDLFPDPSGAHDHLYVTVRSRNRLVYIDADPSDGSLRCGDNGGRCERGPDLDTDALQDPDQEYAPQPSAVTSGSFDAFGVVADEYKGFVATAHDNGSVSLFGIVDSGRPILIDVVPATAPRAVSLLLDPPTRLMYGTAAQGGSVDRIGVRSGVESGLPLPYAAPSLSLMGLSGTQDVRDVVLDQRPRGPDDPLRAYALVRGSANGSNFLQSLVFLELDARTPDGHFSRAVDAVRVGAGASKLTQATIRNRHLLFASCYDAAEIHIIDADKRETVGVIRDVLGPFDMKIDPARLLMYVTDYRTSSLRVVDLRGLATRSTRPPFVIATIGAPMTPGSVR